MDAALATWADWLLLGSGTIAFMAGLVLAVLGVRPGRTHELRCGRCNFTLADVRGDTCPECGAVHTMVYGQAHQVPGRIIGGSFLAVVGLVVTLTLLSSMAKARADLAAMRDTATAQSNSLFATDTAAAAGQQVK